MSIIEKATRRLQELERAGVDVAWGAAGIKREDAANLVHPEAPAAVENAVSVEGSNASSARRARRTIASERQSKEVPLDIERLARDGYIVPGTSRTEMADEFRVIKRPLLANTAAGAPRRAQRSNLIMVTSALPAEGNLALSIASEVDSSVLLVDADVLRPTVLERLGISGKHIGLLELLVDPDLDVSATMLKTNIPKLSVLPSGAPRIDSTELLASAAMDQLLADLADRYPDRIIIFDTPPLLVTTEAKVLASRMGQIVVVVDESRAHQNEIKKGFAMLKDSPVVFSILNKSHMRAETARYGYYADVDRGSRVSMRS
jgi:protein-tyrosine kinase